MRTLKACRTASAVLVVLIPLLAASAFAQQAVDFSAGMVFGGLFAPQQWNPVNVGFRNDSDRWVIGEARFPMERDPGRMDTRVPVRVAPHSRQRIVIPLFMPPAPTTKVSGRIPPVANITWHNETGGWVARSELVAQSVAADADVDATGLPAGGFVLNIVDPERDAPNVESGSQVAAALKSRNIHCAEPSLPPQWVPSQAAVLYACRAISLRTNPELLDPSQRAALVEYVRIGGILMVSAPHADDEVAQSWLAPYLPVELLGHRHARRAGQLPMTGWHRIVEAVAGRGTVVLSDGPYVHAACQQVGLGRVVFTSFPLGALEPAKSAALWQQLLGLDRPAMGMDGTALRRDYGAYLEPMLGKPAASWTAAAFTVALYLGLILVSQLWFRGATRPRAFAAALTVALATALVFVVLTVVKSQSGSLQSARLAVVDIAAGDGGGSVHEMTAYAGADVPELKLAAREGNVMFNAVYNQSERALIYVPRMEAIEAGASAERVHRVWESRWPAAPEWKVQATAAFTPEGLSLRVKSDSGLKLEASQLVWQQERFLVGAVGAQERQVQIGETNRRPRGEFITSSGIASQDQRLKGDIMAALLQRSDSATPPSAQADVPVLLAWASGLPESMLAQPAAGQRGEQVLVRQQVAIEPTRKGQKILIEPSLSRIELREFRGVSYKPARDEWEPSIMTGRWLLPVRAPVQAGTLRPQRVRISLDLDAASYVISLRRGQMKGGKAVENMNGPLVAEWNAPLGPQETVQFECEPADFDAEGRIWLLLDVKLRSRQAGGLPPFWRIGRLGVGIEGEVIAPPAEGTPGVMR